MGIKGLTEFLKDKCPQIYKPVHLSHFAFQKVAIDISFFLYKYKVVFGNNWIDAFINLVCCLRRNEIHCVFIYEFKSVPEKEKEREKRKEEREKVEEKLADLELSYEKYKYNNILNDTLKAMATKRTSLLTNTTSYTITDEEIENAIAKLKARIVHITSEDIAITKEVFNYLGVPYFDAPDEGERFCSQLCIKGKVHGVLSGDTDVMVYGTPYFLNNIDVAKDMCTLIKYQDILDGLNFTHSQWQDFCIMCGTDYNKNIFRIGPQKAYKLIQENNTIENIANIGLDISILNHLRGRELFSPTWSLVQDHLNIHIPHCKKADLEAVAKFLFQNRCNVSLKKIINDFKPKEVIFQE